MNKNNPKIKDSISLIDRITMTKEIADCYFRIDENTGEKLYVPYYADIAFINAFYLYCVDNIEFGYKKDKKGKILLDEFNNPIPENIYDAVTSDQDVYSLVQEYKDTSRNPEKLLTSPYKRLAEQLFQVINDVNDIVDFEKQKLIHYKKDSLSELVDTLTDKAKAIDISRLDLSKMTNFIDQLNPDELMQKLSDAGEALPSKEIKADNIIKYPSKKK